MKKIRKSAVLLTALLCAGITAVQGIPVRAEQLSVKALQDALLKRSDSASLAYDINHDNQVNIYDWILLKKRGLPSEADILEPKGTVHSGDATFYGGGYEGGCAMLDPISKEDYWITAMNLEDYNTAQLAGAYLEVTGESGTIHVLVTDLLPEGKKGDLDLKSDNIFRDVWQDVSSNLNKTVIVHKMTNMNDWSKILKRFIVQVIELRIIHIMN